MNASASPKPVWVPTPPGPVLKAFGEEVSILLTSKQTNGKLTLWLESVPPAGGPPPHRHLREEEWFVVQEGRFEFLLEGTWQELEPGGVAYIPRNTIHTFRNCGDTTGKLLVSTSPSGFETFFQRCADIFAKPGEPNMEAILKVAAEHGIEFVA